MKLRKVVLCALAAAPLTCHQAILTAPLGSTIFVQANPGFIAAHGGVSVISALVIEEPGTVVPDGTVVQFFTNLGRIDEQGKTNDGVARVNLVSDSRSGVATVRAISGPAVSEDVTVNIGGALPRTIFVFADPPRITDSRSTHVFATVVDEFGNPVPNVQVLFRVVSNPATEFLDNGQPIFTDNNGRAEDVMRTRRPRGAGGTARVEARVLLATSIVNTVDIPIE